MIVLHSTTRHKTSVVNDLIKKIGHVKYKEYRLERCLKKAITMVICDVADICVLFVGSVT